MLCLLAFALLDLGLFARFLNLMIGIACLLVAVADFALEGRHTCSFVGGSGELQVGIWS